MQDSLFDICFNLTSDAFHKDEAEVIQRARDAAVTQFLITGSSLEDSVKAVALCERYKEGFYASCGVHPHLAKSWTPETRSELKQLSQRPEVIAIGEAGLDYNRNFSSRDQQLHAFELQCELAVETGKPLFLHERDAHDDFYSVVKSYRDQIQHLVVHCFTGDKKSLFKYLDLDLYIGITGWICDERRGTHLHELVTEIPNDRIMIETDAPYLLPRSLVDKPKNRRNEPCYLPHVAETIARLRKIGTDQFVRQTTVNANRFFNLTEYD